MVDETAVSNVVLVTVDSLRADAIGPYDDDRHTPVLESLADRGTVFDRAFATGNWTPFSFPSMLASRPVFADAEGIGIENSPSLADALSDAGVSTAGFNAANGFLTSHWGYDDGFDEFESFVANVGSGVYSRYLAAHPTVEAWLQLAASPFRRAESWLRREVDDRPFLDTSRMFDVERAAQSFVEETDSPFFLWVHYMDAHTPYAPAPRYIRDVSSDLLGTHRMLLAHTRTGLGLDVGERTLSDLRTLYQAAVRQVDASIGRLLETLSANGLDDETAVVVAGDHGEEFQEHGHLAHYPKLYDELIRVPLLVDVPGSDQRRVDRQVGLDAIPPTVTDLLDVRSPEAWTGSSLVPTVRGDDCPDDDPVVSVTVRGEDVASQPIPRSLEDGDLLVSVRDRDWTYIENVDATADDAAKGGVELYHRPTDPVQQTNLAADPTPEQRALVDEFAAIAADHVDEIRGSDAAADGEGDRGGDEESIDDDLETRLSALGYR
ncbi:sulfatase [Natronococcus jeotgali]|uniref:Sulfatase n=1 Tax=Natronococcus jeotgali DSM 18795 TaxID=1227498 RepID=L9XHG2_9EURY|nr:sulfatase [Natronococcus jeotgali]ELY61032.1 sulfatase [Natronococcus jeotgali DSM 18795]